MTKKAWPTVTNRNVAQPSRVRLSTAPEAGPDVYDVTPVPGTVTQEGTLINNALFTGEKAYIDQNDMPIVTTVGSDGVTYTASVPDWTTFDKSEYGGRILSLIINTDSTTTTPMLTVNNLPSYPLRLMGGTFSSDTPVFPVANYLKQNRVVIVKFDDHATINGIAGVWNIISSYGPPYGGNYINTPWAVTAGGTGANTVIGARTNLSVPAYSYNTAIPWISVLTADAHEVPWFRSGVSTTSSSGLLPATGASSDGWGYVGTSAWPWKNLYVKNIVGASLPASSITGILPLANGGIGGSTTLAAANNLKFKSLGPQYNQINDGAADLNTYTTLGCYVCSMTSIAKTIKNTPWYPGTATNPAAFQLTVESSLASGSNLYIRQIFQEYVVSTARADVPGKVWARISNDGGANWNPWYIMQTPYLDVNTAWNNGDYPNRWAIDTKTLAYWDGSYSTSGASNLTKVGTVTAGHWAASPVVVLYGGTGATTAPGAANNLYVKSLTYGVPSLPANCDLDTMKTPGNYGVASDAAAKLCTNTPHTNMNAFNLTVDVCLAAGTGTTYLRQTVQEWRVESSTNPGCVYQRYSQTSGNAWYPWQIVSGSGYASTTIPGVVKIDGTTITINANGVISASGGGGSGYVLPPASASTLGGIKVGSGLNITADGTLSATGGVSYPISIANGGTGGTTQATARKNLLVPGYVYDTTNLDLYLTTGDGINPQWIRTGLTSNTGSGVIPAVSNSTNGHGQLGTGGWPWYQVYAKTINGALNASNITGVLPIGNGGTGGGGILAAANSLHVMSLGPSSTTLASGTDLNTISTIGNYGCADSKIAKTILNTPYGATASTQVAAFRLTVESTVSNGTSNYIKQVFQEYYMTPENASHPGKVYNRQSTNAGTSWSAWTMVQSNIQTVGSIWANTDYAKHWVVDTQALAYWNGAHTTTGTSNLSKLGTVSNGTWNANPIAIGYGGTGGNTLNAARANLGVLTFTPTNGGTRLLDVNGGDIAWITAGIATGASSNNGIVPAKTDSTNGWGSVGTMTSPFYIVAAKNLFGTLQTSDLSGIVTVAHGGTGGTTVASAKTGLGLGANVGTASVGSDTQFKEVYRIANSLYYVAGIANIKAASGSGVVTVGQLTFPFKLFTPVSGTTPLLLQVQSMVTPAGTYISLNQAAGSTSVVTLSCYGGNATATTCSFAFLVHADV